MATIIGATGNDTLVPGDGDDVLYGDPFDLEHGPIRLNQSDRTVL